MADLRGFDANQVEPSTDFDPLPAGKYPAVITASETKPTKAGTGHFLQLTFQVVEGPFKGRQLWVISVKCKKRDDTGELTNEIKGYAKKESPTPSAAGAQPTANSTPLWRRP